MKYGLDCWMIEEEGKCRAEAEARGLPGLTPASTGSGWCVNAMRGDLVWEVRALKSNFPGFLSEPGEDSPW